MPPCAQWHFARQSSQALCISFLSISVPAPLCHTSCRHTHRLCPSGCANNEWLAFLYCQAGGTDRDNWFQFLLRKVAIFFAYTLPCDSSFLCRETSSQLGAVIRPEDSRLRVYLHVLRGWQFVRWCKAKPSSLDTSSIPLRSFVLLSNGRKRIDGKPVVHYRRVTPKDEVHSSWHIGCRKGSPPDRRRSHWPLASISALNLPLLCRHFFPLPPRFWHPCVCPSVPSEQLLPFRSLLLCLLCRAPWKVLPQSSWCREREWGFRAPHHRRSFQPLPLRAHLCRDSPLALPIPIVGWAIFQLPIHRVERNFGAFLECLRRWCPNRDCLFETDHSYYIRIRAIASGRPLGGNVESPLARWAACVPPPCQSVCQSWACGRRQKH